MINKKVLVVAPYPVTKIEHGGQKRALAIYKFYKSLFREAKYVGVFHRGQYPDWGEDDLPLGDPELIKRVDENPYVSELVTGEAIDKDIHVRSPMAKLLMEFKPDIIHCEQPFPYIGLKVLVHELNMSPKFILGSQNIEYSLKERIYCGLKVPEYLWRPAIEQTKKLEYDFSKHAYLVVTVNDSDALEHKKMGAKRCVVAPNGIEKSVASQSEIEYWQKFKRANKISKIATFVGSGHPPNWLGFLSMIGEDTSFMRTGEKILVAGGTADYLRERYKDKKKHAKFGKGIILLGKLEEGRLTGLIEQSEIILLPIGAGGGSNLKTAEAILSGKKFVATSRAFHGFEKFKNLPNKWVANDRAGFQAAIRKALAANYQERTPAQIKLAESVQWKECLKPLGEALSKPFYGKILAWLQLAIMRK